MPHAQRIQGNYRISHFRVEISVIGYGFYGESIVLLLLDGDDVFYSIVIDSGQYTRDGAECNLAAEILREKHVNRIDVLCWTHPHEDHSKGLMDLVDSFCDGNTRVLFPTLLLNNDLGITKLKGVDVNTINGILGLNNSYNTIAMPIGVYENSFLSIDRFTISDVIDGTDIRHAFLSALTPVNSLLAESFAEGRSRNPNYMSISLVLDIDGYGFYFGGDTTNEQIRFSYKQLLRRCKFIKIPHHTSPTASELINHITASNINAACTTAFKHGRSILPDETVIESYKKLCEVYATADVKSTLAGNYGIVRYTYDFSGEEILLQTQMLGNAIHL